MNFNFNFLFMLPPLILALHQKKLSKKSKFRQNARWIFGQSFLASNDIYTRETENLGPNVYQLGFFLGQRLGVAIETDSKTNLIKVQLSQGVYDSDYPLSILCPDSPRKSRYTPCDSNDKFHFRVLVFNVIRFFIEHIKSRFSLNGLEIFYALLVSSYEI